MLGRVPGGRELPAKPQQLGERPGTVSPTASRRNQPCRHLYFGLLAPMLRDFEVLLFPATQTVCHYDAHRKQ